MKRRSVEKTVVKYTSTWNKTLYEADIMEPTKGNDGSEIWPLHWTIRLKRIDEFEQKLKKNLMELKDIAQKLVVAAAGF